MPEFTDQTLVTAEHELSAPVSIFKDLEELNRTLLFAEIRRDLGADDALVQKMPAKESPEQLAHRLVSGTHLDDPKVRSNVGLLVQQTQRYLTAIYEELSESRQVVYGIGDRPPSDRVVRAATARRPLTLSFGVMT